MLWAAAFFAGSCVLFLRSLLARLLFWRTRSPVPPPQPIPTPASKRRVAKRPHQPHPTLFPVCMQSRLQQAHYCGQVALAALTDANPDYVTMMIQILRDDPRPVRGTYLHELAHVFDDLGYRLKVIATLDAINPPTFALWERQRSNWEFNRPLLVALTGHWVAVHGHWFADTQTNGIPVRLSDAPRRRARVRFAYAVTPIARRRLINASNAGIPPTSDEPALAPSLGSRPQRTL
jgi:hypothetical protein